MQLFVARYSANKSYTIMQHDSYFYVAKNKLKIYCKRHIKIIHCLLFAYYSSEIGGIIHLTVSGGGGWMQLSSSYGRAAIGTQSDLANEFLLSSSLHLRLGLAGYRAIEVLSSSHFFHDKALIWLLSSGSVPPLERLHRNFPEVIGRFQECK